jgi:aryl-alcohol dehydrogenase-like predicted oxidoreductase
LSGTASALARAAEQLKITPSQLALAWLLWRSQVMLPIPGTSRVDHLEQNVAAASLKIDESELQELGAAQAAR